MTSQHGVNSESPSSPQDTPIKDIKHTDLTDVILNIIDEGDSNRYQVALRLTAHFNQLITRSIDDALAKADKAKQHSVSKSLTHSWRKKPVVIKAVQFVDNDSAVTILRWIRHHGGEGYAVDYKLIIQTLEGDMTADRGDYIIRGVKGEFYPCKPDIFLETYEKVTDLATTDHNATSDVANPPNQFNQRRS